jgi:hypothetical protein
MLDACGRVLQRDLTVAGKTIFTLRDDCDGGGLLGLV